MPTLQFQLPGGGYASASVPDDATDEELNAIGNHIASQAPAPAAPTSSAMGAFGRGVTSHAGEGIGGGVGAYGGMEGGAALGSMIAPGPGTVIGGLIGAGVGAVAGGYFGQKAQGAPSPEQQAQLETDQQQYPKSAGAGEMLAQAPVMLASPEVGLEEGLAARLAKNAAGGMVFGGTGAGAGVASGTMHPGDIPGELVKGAATMAPLGVPGEAVGAIAKYLGKPIYDAATLAVTNSAYNAVTGKAPFDPSTLTGTALQNLPAFVGMNLVMGLLHAHAPELAKDAKPNEAVAPPENVPQSPPAESPPGPVNPGANNVPAPEVTAPPEQQKASTGGNPPEEVPTSTEATSVAGSTPINNATVEQVRQSMGEAPMAPRTGQTDADMNARADAELAKNPGYAEGLLAHMDKNPAYAPEPFETKILERHHFAALDAADKTGQAVTDAWQAKQDAEKGKDPATIAAATVIHSMAESAHQDASDRLLAAGEKYTRAGTQNSNALRARVGKAGFLDKNGLIPVAKIEQNLRAKNGGAPLKPEELVAIHAKHKAETAAVEALKANQAKSEEIAHNAAIDQATKEVLAENNAPDASKIYNGTGLAPRLPVARKSLPAIPGALHPQTGDIVPHEGLPGDIAQHAFHGLGLLEKVFGLALPKAKLLVKRMMGKDYGKYSPAEKAIHVGERQTIHTAIHEAAHWLDHMLAGGGKSYASEGKGLAGTVAKMVNESAGMKLARANRSSSGRMMKGTIDYLGRPEEAFARAVEHVTAKEAGLESPKYDALSHPYARLTSEETEAIMPHVKAALERFEQRAASEDSDGHSRPSADREPASGAPGPEGGNAARNGIAPDGEQVGVTAREAYSRDASKEDEDKKALGKYTKEVYKRIIRDNLEKPLTRQELEKRAVADVQKAYPNATAREIRDAHSAYHKVSFPSKDALKTQISQVKGVQKLVSRLEDILNGIAPKRFGLQRREPTEEAKELTKQINEALVNAGMKGAKIEGGKNIKSELTKLKDRMKRATAENERRIATGDFSKRTPRQVQLDDEARDLQYKLKQSQYDKERAIKKIEMANITPARKLMATIQGWHRAFALSGVTGLVKLPAAAAGRAALTPLDQMAGSALRHVVPRLAEQSPRHGAGFSISTEARAAHDGLMSVFKNAKTILKTGLTPSDAHDPKPNMHDIEHFGGKGWAELIGHVHALAKAPAKESEFKRSSLIRTQHEIDAGNNPTDWDAQLRITNGALMDAKESVLQGKNALSEMLKSTSAQLKQSKKFPTSSAVLANVIDYLFPIKSVPINFAIEAYRRTPIGLAHTALEARMAYKKGLENLPEAYKDRIMMNLKRGSVGSAVWLLGYALPQIAGGYYQQGEKRKPGDLKPGDIGFQHSHLFMHNAAAEALTMGATTRKIADHMLRGHPEGTIAGLGESFLGLGRNTPFVRTPQDVLAMGYGRGDERTRAEGQFAQGALIPRGVTEIAQFMDPMGRRTKTVPDFLKAGIPGLRETLPAKPLH